MVDDLPVAGERGGGEDFFGGVVVAVATIFLASADATASEQRVRGDGAREHDGVEHVLVERVWEAHVERQFDDLAVLGQDLDHLSAVAQDEARPLGGERRLVVKRRIAGLTHAVLHAHSIPDVDAHVWIIPINVGEIQSGLHAALACSRDKLGDNVPAEGFHTAVRVVGRTSDDCGFISLQVPTVTDARVRVIHGEPLVVLRREVKELHSSAVHQGNPLGGVEVRRIPRLVLVPVPVHPREILSLQGPAFRPESVNGVLAPVNPKAKLHVVPSFNGLG
mmetsp:Transcript_5361/g.12688  ORF Transcript_5361/g.12688 Transcript_5361/m.12688 type:complete len:278 (-) Transcript_5361:91-924(-)